MNDDVHFQRMKMAISMNCDALSHFSKLRKTHLEVTLHLLVVELKNNSLNCMKNTNMNDAWSVVQ